MSTFKRIFKLLISFLPKGRIAQGTLLSLFWQGLKLVCLAAWLVIIARTIGAQGYGTYAGISGVATTAGSFVGLGLGLVMYQDAIRTPSTFSILWRKTLGITLLSGILFLAVFIVVSPRLFGSSGSTWLIIAIGVSELIFFPLMTNAAFAFAANGKIGWSSALPSLMALFRLAALIFFLHFSQDKSLLGYIWYHTFGTFLASMTCVFLVYHILKPTSPHIKYSANDFFKGMGFCATWASNNALTSLDKFLALKLAGAELSGIYSSAYRFTTMVMQPIDALVGAATPRLFAQSDLNPGQSQLIKYLFVSVIMYGVFAGAFVFYLPNLIVLILGDSFTQNTDILKWCAMLAPCYGLRTLATNILLASNKVKIKVIIEVCGLLALFCLAYGLIPRYGLSGCVAMLIITEMLMALLGCIAIVKMNADTLRNNS